MPDMKGSPGPATGTWQVALPDKTVTLSAVEYAALTYAAGGYTAFQSAMSQRLSHHTVKSALRRAAKKLRANNTTHAIVIAMRAGVLR